MGKLKLYIILFAATLATYFIYDYIKYKNLQAAILELSIAQPDLLNEIMHRNCNEVEKNIRSVSSTIEYIKTNQLMDESLADLYTVIHTDTSVIGGFKLSKKNTILLEKPAGDLFAERISYMDYFNNDFIVLYELRDLGNICWSCPQDRFYGVFQGDSLLLDSAAIEAMGIGDLDTLLRLDSSSFHTYTVFFKKVESSYLTLLNCDSAGTESLLQVTDSDRLAYQKAVAIFIERLKRKEIEKAVITFKIPTSPIEQISDVLPDSLNLQE